MLAVDTNVVVRYLTGDDIRQAGRARSLIDNQPVWVATTVLLESDWVLRSSYRLARTEVSGLLRNFAGLPTVTLENHRLVALALNWCQRGLDFADALHVAAAAECDAFVTFDTDLIKVANGTTRPVVREP